MPADKLCITCADLGENRMKTCGRKNTLCRTVKDVFRQRRGLPELGQIRIDVKGIQSGIRTKIQGMVRMTFS